MTSPSVHNLRGALLGAGLATLLCNAVLAQEVQVLLRNGDRLTGTVLTEETGRLTLSNALLGRFTVPVGQIDRRIPVAAGIAVPPANREAALVVTNSALARQLDDLMGAYVLNRITAGDFYRQRAKLLAAADASERAGVAARGGKPAAVIPPKPPVKISGEIQAGLDLGLATKERQLYSGRMKLIHTQDRLRNTADFSFTYGRTDGEVSANRMEGMLKTDYDLTREVYLYNLGGGGYDEIRKLENYFQIGPGLGDHLLRLTNFTLNLEGGGNFQRQSRTDGTETDVFYYRLGQESKFWLGQKFTLDEKFEYFPQWNNFSEYKLRIEANLKYWLKGNLFLNLSMVDLYDTMPARGVDPNDLQIRSTIGVKF